jgi:hypothetical protein
VLGRAGAGGFDGVSLLEVGDGFFGAAEHHERVGAEKPACVFCAEEFPVVSEGGNGGLVVSGVEGGDRANSVAFAAGQMAICVFAQGGEGRRRSPPAYGRGW